MATATAPKTLREAILFFADYENCRKAVEAIRWPDGVVRCPTCGSDHVTSLASQRRFKCYAKHPRAQFSAKVGTIFEDSPLPLKHWMLAVWMLSNCKNGISSYELARALGGGVHGGIVPSKSGQALGKVGAIVSGQRPSATGRILKSPN